MKTLTQVVLPIVAIAGIVFGITYMSNYTASDRSKKNDDTKSGNVVQPLKFAITKVAPDPSDWRLKDWNSDLEVGAKGSFDFWFTNVSEQPVRLAVMGTSCQCAGVDAAILPMAEWNQFFQQAVSPFQNLMNMAHLVQKIEMKPLSDHGSKGEITVPAAASATQPQVGIVRLKWEAKEQQTANDTPVRISAELVSQLPNANAGSFNLEALYTVVHPLRVYWPGAANEIRLGDLVAGTTVTREIICWSKTRDELPLAFELAPAGNYKDCVTWSTPARLTPDELTDLTNKLTAQAQAPVKIRSAYRVQLTVQEQRQIELNGKKVVRQLDLGPINFQFQVSAGTKPMPIPVRGVVRGDVRIVSGSESTDAIDFGTSFSSNESKTKNVTIRSERAGLDLELIPAETIPNYLQVQLLPGTENDGLKTWKLQVTIPEKTLYGDLPPASHIILQTKDPTPRRVRIPVRAQTSS